MTTAGRPTPVGDLMAIEPIVIGANLALDEVADLWATVRRSASTAPDGPALMDGD